MKKQEEAYFKSPTCAMWACAGVDKGASTDVTPPRSLYGPCFNSSITVDPVQAAVGENVTVTVEILGQISECFNRKAQVTAEDTHNKHEGTQARHTSGTGSRVSNFAGVFIELYLSGPGVFADGLNKRQTEEVSSTIITTDVNGAATADVEILGSGPIQVWVNFFLGFPPYLPTLATINPSQAPAPIGSPVAKLLLSPAKSYRHCDDTITLSALAVDANSAPCGQCHRRLCCIW